MDDLLSAVITQGGSDLHLIAGEPPRVRRHGDLLTMSSGRVTGQQVRDTLYKLMAPRLRADFERGYSVNFAIGIDGLARLRVSAFHHLNGIGAALRVIPESVGTVEQLGLPALLADLSLRAHGLILVTGRRGSGRSTTLAAMLDSVNRGLTGHIITIEDPLEFAHARKRCLVSQREVGEHVASLTDGLRLALRYAPDVILIGELREAETLALALAAADAGILVVSTLHAGSAVDAVEGVIDRFPADTQPHARSMLSSTMRAVISQQLIKRADGGGRVPAVEILLNTPAVAHLIREGKIDQLDNVIQGGALVGMQGMDNALRKLLDARLITGQAAFEACRAKPEFQRYACAAGHHPGS